MRSWGVAQVKGRCANKSVGTLILPSLVILFMPEQSEGSQLNLSRNSPPELYALGKGRFCFTQNLVEHKILNNYIIYSDMALSKSAKFYRENPTARAKKSATDKKINSRPEQKAKRAELGRINRKADARGVDRKGRDYDHAVKKYVPVKTNRGRKNEGGRKKK